MYQRLVWTLQTLKAAQNDPIFPPNEVQTQNEPTSVPNAAIA
jgi:hypothetical protein